MDYHIHTFIVDQRKLLSCADVLLRLFVPEWTVLLAGSLLLVLHQDAAAFKVQPEKRLGQAFINAEPPAFTVPGQLCNLSCRGIGVLLRAPFREAEHQTVLFPKDGSSGIIQIYCHHTLHREQPRFQSDSTPVLSR